MTAYPPTGPPGVVANFPTVYDPALGAPYGPMHRYPQIDAYLGTRASPEYDADRPYDWDGLTNLAPAANLPDRDGFDDGVNPATLSFSHCALSTFNYTVTTVGLSTRTRYLNVWLDWNQDGDWADSFSCSGNPAAEWAVQNVAITLAPGTATLTTPPIRAWQPGGPINRWMRISLSERPFPAGSAGNGPISGFFYGETEDYFLTVAVP